MVKLQSIKPKWVLVNGSLHEVSNFAHLLPQKRPHALCPVCQHSITFKLGNHRAYHYAHQPEDVCITTQPETALHLNTKFYIYKQLLQARTVYVEESCWTISCEAKRKQIWLEEWDDVKVEYLTDSFRPDIALLSNGKTIGAIEILVSHPVSAQKAQYFDSQKISWLELQAEENLYEGDDAWTPEKPLPLRQYHPQLESWKCDMCKKSEERARKVKEEQEKERREQEEKQRNQREYEQNNYEVIHSAKMVDFYFKSGKKYREVYYVMKQVKDKEWVKAWVKTEKNQLIASENTPITEESLKRLNEAVKKHIAEYRDNKGAVIIDEFMKWRRWEKGQKFVARDTSKFPFRYSLEDSLLDEYQLRWILK